MSFHPKLLLVPVDVDITGDVALAERLVDDACSFAQPFGAALRLLAVALPQSAPLPMAEPASPAARALLDVVSARNTHAQRVLRDLEARARSHGVTADAELWQHASGNVPESIVSAATALSADAIILSTHARRGVKRLLLGSVAERVAHLAPVPVLLLPPTA